MAREPHVGERFVRRAKRRRRPLCWARAVWAALGGFAADWRRSRPSASLLPGLPSIVAAVAVTLLVWLGQRQREVKFPLISRYARAARAALEQQRFDDAELLCCRLSHLDAGNATARFGPALAAERRGDVARARRMMEGIAPPDRVGYAPAHWWLARHLAGGKRNPAPEESGVLEHHLLAAVGGGAGDADAHEMLGRLYASQGRFGEAAAQMSEAAKQRPELLLALSSLYGLNREIAAAETAAEQARQRYRRQTRRRPSDVAARLAWAASEALLGDRAVAEKVLIDGLGLANDDRCRKALAKLYVNWYDADGGARGADAAGSLELLDRALQYDPNDSAALTRLALLASRVHDGRGAARTRLGRALAAGRPSGAVYWILGTCAAESGQYEAAAAHLERAYRLQPDWPQVANNLAWALAHSHPPQLARALKLANAAISTAPADIEFRDTRGRILCRLGRDRESLGDLEMALRGKPGDRDLHRILAGVYERLGDHQLARQHDRLAGTTESGSAPELGGGGGRSR